MEEETFGISLNTEDVDLPLENDTIPPLENNVVVPLENDINLPVRDIDLSVLEYKKAEQIVKDNFIVGIIGLGKILSDEHAIWEPQRKWKEFINKSELSMSGANQMMRIFEYSKDNFEKLKKANVTNWERINLFLALSEIDKIKLADEINGEEVSRSVFKEVVGEFKEELITMETMSEEQILDLMNSTTINRTVLSNVPLAAKILVKNVNKEKKMSSKCSPLAEALLYVQKTILLINDNYDTLSEEDIRFWKDLIKKQAKVLSEI